MSRKARRLALFKDNVRKRNHDHDIEGIVANPAPQGHLLPVGEDGSDMAAVADMSDAAVMDEPHDGIRNPHGVDGGLSQSARAGNSGA